MRNPSRLLPIMLTTLPLVLSGAVCFPLFNVGDDGVTDPTPAAPLTIGVRFPASDREVPEGTVVEIDWTLSNSTGSDAIATVILRDRSDLTNTVLAGGLRVTGRGGRQVTAFDTSDFGGRRFDVVIQALAGDESTEETAGGQITVNGIPAFEFTEPFEAVVLGEDAPEPDPNSDEPPPDPTVTIRWIGSDPEGAGSVAIFGDTDDDHESGNEFMITEADLAAEGEIESFDWDGVPADGPVEEETVFNLYAEISDDLNETFIVEGLATITVPAPEEEEEEETFALEFTDPNMDVDFLSTDDALTLAFTYDEPNDVLVDIGIDTDDNHTNGNETTILFQRLISRKDNEESFEWDGTDSDGGTVPNGIYRVFLVLNRGAGSPQIIDTEGLVFRRDAENDPLIAITAPAADDEKNAGEFITFRWRDDDPDESAVIRLTLDDDEMPDEGTETDAPEIEILADRMAGGDGVQDTFAYKVPDTLAPGSYFVFAYIDADGAAPYDQVSIAPGRLVVADPDE